MTYVLTCRDCSVEERYENLEEVLAAYYDHRERYTAHHPAFKKREPRDD